MVMSLKCNMLFLTSVLLRVRPSLSRTAYQGQSQQFVVKPKYYPSLNQPMDRAIPLSGGYGSTNGQSNLFRWQVSSG